MQLNAEIYIKNPSIFIANNCNLLLPEWENAPKTLAIVLILSPKPLDGQYTEIEENKRILFKNFVKWGKFIKQKADKKGILTEIISPKDGTPMYSKKGDLTFDLVAIIHELLGFKYSQTTGGCKVIHHPIWGSAIYPGLLLSDVDVTQMQTLLYSRGK